MRLSIFEILELEKKGKKLSKEERNRLRIFREKSKKLETLFTSKCKNCGEKIHKDFDFCSSECKREWEKNG